MVFNLADVQAEVHRLRALGQAVHRFPHRNSGGLTIRWSPVGRQLPAPTLRRDLTSTVAARAEAREAAQSIGYPVVLKPRALMASEGVKIVHSEEELDEALSATASLRLEVGSDHQFTSVLIEGYVDGAEYPVDGAVIRGSYVTLFIAADGCVYCCAVMDAWSPRIVGWAIADHIRTGGGRGAADGRLAASSTGGNDRAC